MVGFVYALVDPRTLMVRYIGRTTQGQARFKQHEYSNNNTYVCRWIKSLRGAGLMFIPVVLEECTSRESLMSSESWWVAYGKLSGWELTNLTNGGDGSWGYRVTAETREKLRQLHLNKPKSAEHIENMRRAKSTPEAIEANRRLHTGRKRSAETRARIGAASRRRVATPEARANMSAAGKRRPPRTQATRDKLSLVHKGRKFTPEHIANMSKSRLGKKASPETRERMSEAHRARWAKIKSEQSS